MSLCAVPAETGPGSHRAHPPDSDPYPFHQEQGWQPMGPFTSLKLHRHRPWSRKKGLQNTREELPVAVRVFPAKAEGLQDNSPPWDRHTDVLELLITETAPERML